MCSMIRMVLHLTNTHISMPTRFFMSDKTTRTVSKISETKFKNKTKAFWKKNNDIASASMF